MDRIIKKDIIIKVSDATGIKHEDVSTVIETFLLQITSHLSQGQSVALRDFGTLELRVSRRKLGRNPKRPETPIHIPDKNVVRFRAARKLRQLAANVPVPA